MGKIASSIILGLLLVVSSAQASALRSFVSLNGSDNNPCTITLPCRNWAAAQAQTIAGGDLVALTSGGFGALTITQSLQLLAPSGITVFATAIVINAPGANIRLSGLTVEGNGGNIGVDVQSAASVTLDHCSITGVTTGIKSVDSDLTITNSLIHDTTGNAIQVEPVSFATTKVVAHYVFVENSTIADSGASAIYATDGVGIGIHSSTIKSKAYSDIEMAVGDSGSARLNILNSHFVGSTTGIVHLLLSFTGTTDNFNVQISDNNFLFGTMLQATGNMSIMVRNNNIWGVTGIVNNGSVINLDDNSFNDDYSVVNNSGTVYTFQNNSDLSGVSGNPLVLKSQH